VIYGDGEFFISSHSRICKIGTFTKYRTPYVHLRNEKLFFIRWYAHFLSESQFSLENDLCFSFEDWKAPKSLYKSGTPLCIPDLHKTGKILDMWRKRNVPWAFCVWIRTPVYVNVRGLNSGITDRGKMPSGSSDVGPFSNWVPLTSASFAT